jgi:uncharacterized protein (DUF2141 family)
MIFRLAIAAAAAFTCLGLAPAASVAAEITITIDNLRSSQGQVILCLFSAESSDKAAYPDCAKGKPVRQGKVEIAGGSVVVTYKGLKDGVYAVAAIHDENGNGALDTNFIGIPTEGVGVSNNPRLMGKPQFDEARLEIKGKTAITVSAKYIL